MNKPRPPSLIPTYWSPEEAASVYEFLRDLTEFVWQHYQHHIAGLVAPLNERHDDSEPLGPHPEQSDLFETDHTPFDSDGVPF